jgi:AcrR family transcriptional regulator
METKTQPLQERSRQTFDAILRAAGELLAEVGFERFSTNLVCKRAALTPPALYRYFPNKYALLRELAQRLMEAQDEAVYAWIEAGGLDGDNLDEIAARNRDILGRVIDVTSSFPGGVWILRAMRAVPMMRDVRLASSATVADRVFASLKMRYRSTDPERLRRAAWLTTELSNAVIEMVLEQPAHDPEEILTEACRMMALYYIDFH